MVPEQTAQNKRITNPERDMGLNECSIYKTCHFSMEVEWINQAINNTALIGILFEKNQTPFSQYLSTKHHIESKVKYFFNRKK